jgi:hypothetical protein
VLVDDDPWARQRWLIGWRHPLRALNACVVRVLGTRLLTVRIDLDLDLDAGDVGRRVRTGFSRRAGLHDRPDPGAPLTERGRATRLARTGD